MSARKHIVVVGSGIAGLVTAIRLSAACDVTLVTKLEITESNTRWAQGGIAAAMFPDDSVAEHVADTLRAGAGLCKLSAVETLCAEGPARIRDLIALGVAFDTRDGELARGLEAAHSKSRVLHAKGDATGLSIELALVDSLRRSAVRVMEHTFACDVVLKHGAVCGLEIVDEHGVRRVLSADAVVLASGGAGQLYLHTTNPAAATGDGTAMALRAGARVADAEFYQFHPTALAVSGTFLISEAVRGEGAILLDAHGRRFMPSVHPDAELAPRDVVARAIAMQMKLQDGKAVMLDATRMGAGFLRERFPTIDSACKSYGFDWSREPIPVTPAAHYWMGGVQTDLVGRTSVAGLFAVGEVACTGVHGANRLASNSLLESLVFAWRCADSLRAEDADLHEAATFDERDDVIAMDVASEVRNETAVDRTALRTLMWNAAGIERNGDELRAALKTSARWVAADDDVVSMEDANLLALARLVMTGALAREESRGAHYRSDFTETRADWTHSLAYVQKVSVPCL